MGAAAARRLARDGRRRRAVRGGTVAWRAHLGVVDPVPEAAVVWDRFYHVILGTDRRVLAMLEELGDCPGRLGGQPGGLLRRRHGAPASSAVELISLPFLGPIAKLRIAPDRAAGGLWSARESVRPHHLGPLAAPLVRPPGHRAALAAAAARQARPQRRTGLGRVHLVDDPAAASRPGSGQGRRPFRPRARAVTPPSWVRSPTGCAPTGSTCGRRARSAVRPGRRPAHDVADGGRKRLRPRAGDRGRLRWRPGCAPQLDDDERATARRRWSTSA